MKTAWVVLIRFGYVVLLLASFVVGFGVVALLLNLIAITSGLEFLADPTIGIAVAGIAGGLPAASIVYRIAKRTSLPLNLK